MKRFAVVFVLLFAGETFAAISGVTPTLVVNFPGNPTGLATGPDGNLWFSDSLDHGIGKMVIAAGSVSVTGYLIASAMPAGKQPGAVAAITEGPDGALWFTWDDSAHTTAGIGRITTAGTITLFPVDGETYAGGSIVSGADGNLWYTSGFSRYVGRVTPQGVATRFHIPTRAGASHIVAGADGNLWVSEDAFINSTGAIGRIAPDGTFVEFPLTSTSSVIGGTAAGPDGNVWFTDMGTNAIGTITPSGTISEYPIPTPNVKPAGIVTAPDGNIWFVESNAYQIGRVTIGGSAPVIEEQPFNGHGTASDLIAFPSAHAKTNAMEPLDTVTFRLIGNFSLPSAPCLLFFDITDPLSNVCPSITVSVAVQPLVAGLSATLPITVTGGVAPYTYSVNGSLPPGLSISSGVIFGVPTTAGTYTFRINATDSKGCTGSTPVTLVVSAAAPDLTVSKTHVYDPEDDSVEYQITVRNDGAAATTSDFEVDDALPAGVAIDPEEEKAEGWQVFNGPVLTYIGHQVLKPAESIILKIAAGVTADDGVTINNQAKVAGGGETNTANDTSNADSFVTGERVVNVTKDHAGDLSLGTFHWTIRVKNKDNIATDGPITITDKLPDGVTLQENFSTPDASCSVAGGTVTCKTDTALGPGATITIVLPVKSAPNDGEIFNRAGASGGGTIEDTISLLDSAADRLGKPVPKPAVQPTNGRH